jgi:predicted O-methyltransferase YrrM
MSATATKASPTFTVDWFYQYAPQWEALVRDYLPARDKFLEVGSFEGRSACWMIEHALSPTGSLHCIDTWKGSPEFSGYFSAEVISGCRDRFIENVRAVKGSDQKVTMIEAPSFGGLATLIASGHAGTFDLAYIDGSHIARDVLTDAVMAYRLVKPRGVIVFDDYLWSPDKHPLNRPKIAIDQFVEIFEGCVEVLLKDHQFIVRKLQQ